MVEIIEIDIHAAKSSATLCGYDIYIEIYNCIVV